MTFAVFGQTLGHDFINYDDQDYVYENPHVLRGLTFQGILWAFTHTIAGNWHPLSTISHMLDCQWYGLNPCGHHLTNVLLHTTAVILLFLVLRRMTGFLWRSAFVAAVFAIHPLRVESVAWVAERKDVLSGVFFMLTIGAYARYAEESKVQPVIRCKASTLHAPGWYVLALLFFALGLMCKPMLVTLPFVVLLLDYWPLNRLASGGDGGKAISIPRQLLLEKIPLLALSAAACAGTMLTQKPAIAAFEATSWWLRLGNTVLSYVIYLGHLVYPAGLTLCYPYPGKGLPFQEIALAFALLALISAVVLRWWRKYPCLLVGWLWYLGMLVPAIGLVRVSKQAYEDRYTYLPQIGLYLLLTWAVAALCAQWRLRRAVLSGGATIILIALFLCARTQAAYWRNAEALWTHALACSSDHYIAHSNLADVLARKGRVDEAILHYQQALKIKPDQNAELHNNLANHLLQKGRVDEAIALYQQALKIKPNYGDAHYNLGTVLLRKGSVDKAIPHFQRVLEINPRDGQTHYGLGTLLLRKGMVDEAITHFQAALAINPGDAQIHNTLGKALVRKGLLDEAIAHYQKALDINPAYAQAQNNLARVLAISSKASLRDGIKAVQLAQQANQLTGDKNPVVLGTLAAAYAEAGRFPEAVETAQHALQRAEALSNTAQADAIRAQMKLYQTGVPFHTAEQPP